MSRDLKATEGGQGIPGGMSEPLSSQKGLGQIWGGRTPSTAPQSQGSLASTLMGTCNDQIPWGGEALR